MLVRPGGGVSAPRRAELILGAHRPTIAAYGHSGLTASFYPLLVAVVVREAEALQVLSVPEQYWIATMRPCVIRYPCGLDLPFLATCDTEGIGR